MKYLEKPTSLYGYDCVIVWTWWWCFVKSSTIWMYVCLLVCLLHILCKIN